MKKFNDGAGFNNRALVANSARTVHEVYLMVKPIRPHTRFERARIIGARALQIGMGAPLNAPEDVLREAFKEELISLYGLEEASVRFVLDPLKIAMYEYENELIPIDTDPHTS
tara:strand:+ start:2608 stop:2946 length:339 start_codon:yes stop_codon:yes gene_type:complete